MRYEIRDTHTGDTCEDFTVQGHRNTKRSTDLDAMKVAHAWGYSKVKGYALETEDGRVLDIVDPYKTAAYKREMEKDYLFLLRAA